MNEELQQKYKDHDFDYDINLHPNDKNELVFFEQVKIAKKPVIHNIIKVVRTRQGKDEHVYYHETLRSKDYLNNPIDHSRVVGKYKDPQFISSVDPSTRKPRTTEIQGYEEVYQFSWTPNIIDVWLSQEGFQLDDICGFVAKDGGKTYGGFPYEQFCEASYEDLILLGKFGTTEPEGIQKEIRKRNKQIASSPT